MTAMQLNCFYHCRQNVPQDNSSLVLLFLRLPSTFVLNQFDDNGGITFSPLNISSRQQCNLLFEYVYICRLSQASYQVPAFLPRSKMSCMTGNPLQEGCRLRCENLC